MKFLRTYILKIFILLSIFNQHGLSAEEMNAPSWISKINKVSSKINDTSLITKDPVKGLVLDQLLTDTAIAAYGFTYWHWGTRSFHAGHEGWFGWNTATGGSDKLGHYYMTYLLSRVLSSRMEDRGLDSAQATLYGSLSALLSMTLLEVGDATSRYGFSKEDLICDTLGSLSAYLLRRYTTLDDFIDIRIEYLPSSHHLKDGDHTTDYSNMRHLIAFNLSGFDALKNTPLRYVELQVGYYTRGFRTYDRMPKSQQVYVGIGLSLKQLGKESGVKMLENLFEFYQPGHTYADTKVWKRHK
jgi:hypothetical protein